MANFLLKYLCQNKYVYPRTLQLSDINQTLVLIGRVPSKAMVNLWWAPIRLVNVFYGFCITAERLASRAVK